MVYAKSGMSLANNLETFDPFQCKNRLSNAKNVPMAWWFGGDGYVEIF